ncbi:hypothetical protein ONZ51_g1248 [Trametes cubensis]|uniref:Uncharacterized protein n=1 Tax=Trametes cubensis TaxID=1111947 RepID=A0AAD7U1U5_9APHY|nr:hypothetical protein ONZ51_g1248 [Trametes cubensis]
MMDKRTAASWRAAFYVVLVFTILNAAFVFRTVSTFERILLPTKTVYSYVGDDHPTELPIRLPRVGLLLVPGEPYFSLYADDEWGTIFPPNDGFVPRRACAPQPHVPPLNRAPAALPRRLPRRGGGEGAKGDHPEGRRAGFAHHVEHCLRFMRQTVLCQADTTLDDAGVEWKNGRWEYYSTGYGAVHRCRDWTALRRYLAEHPPLPLNDDDYP